MNPVYFQTQFICSLAIDEIPAHAFINTASNTWMQEVSVNRINKLGHDSTDSFLQARQLSFDSTGLPSSQDISIDTSILVGNEYKNTLRGLAGWDILESGGGADLIHGGMLRLYHGVHRLDLPSQMSFVLPG